MPACWLRPRGSAGELCYARATCKSSFVRRVGIGPHDPHEVRSVQIVVNPAGSRSF